MAPDRHSHRRVRGAGEALSAIIVPRRAVRVDPAGLRARATVLRAARRFLDDRGYLEVPTPSIVPSAALEQTLYPRPADGGWLRTSPEFALKRVLASGLPRIYEIGSCFRGRESGRWHRVEFLMLEWYRAGAGLEDLIAEATALVDAAATALGRPPPRWSTHTVADLFRRHAGVDLTTAGAEDLAPGHHEAWDDAFFRRWVDDVEPKLGGSGAIVVTEFPASQSAFAAVHDDGRWPVARRFELLWDGLELANAFEELLDPDELRARFLQTNVARAAAGEPPHPIDLDLVDAVGRMPKTSGIAIGLDRLVAALVGRPDLDGVVVP